MCFGGGGNHSAQASNDAAAQANLKLAQQQRQDEIDRQNRITQGIDNVNKAFSGFNDAYYNKKGQDYLGYYQPQVEHQFNQAKDDTLYQLARQGLVNSSAGSKVYGDLATDYGNQQQAVQSQANNYVQQARSAVEQQRNALVNQVTATANPQAAANAATNAVGSLQMIQPSGGYSPLAGLFNTFSGAAASGLQNYAYGNNGGLIGQMFKNGSSGSSARTVT